jgi:microcystin degradation protein MlrC
MPRILIAQLKQETATFNPVRTRYNDFEIQHGDDILRTMRGTKTEIAGALEVFDEDGGIELLPTIAAWACSGGPICTEDLDRLTDEIVDAVRRSENVDAVYLVLHGAMAGEEEGDPEGRLLAAVREIVGDVPIVASLDLHAVLTDRMIEAADVLVPYHTYPHTDHYQTGQRSARVLLKLLQSSIPPTTIRIPLPMLVRGDELLTATGLFGEAIRICQQLETSDSVLAAGVLIGNPFTDVPALQSNVLVTTSGDHAHIRGEAIRLARFMWDHRARFVAALTPLDEAIRQAAATRGLTIFSDAADATASGAPGDSNAILKGLLQYKYPGTALLAIVDASAVSQAFDAGVGATIDVAVGGTLDPSRHTPLRITSYVKRLSDGVFRYEDGTTGRAGPTAVLTVRNHPHVRVRDDCIHIVATSRPVFVVGRRVFLAEGLDPQDFDLVVVKSPNGFRTYYDSIAARIVPVDVPGATSANLRSLPFQNCVRPIFPLDDNVTFDPESAAVSMPAKRGSAGD